MRKLARITIVLALLAVPAVALASTGSRRVYVPDCTKAVYKPRQLLLACGDGTNFLTHLTWSRWTRRKAVGSGIDEVDNCRPDCARGRFHAYPATVTLTRPRRCAHVRRHRVFKHLVLDYVKAHPGSSKQLNVQLFCP